MVPPPLHQAPTSDAFAQRSVALPQRLEVGNHALANGAAKIDVKRSRKFVTEGGDLGGVEPAGDGDNGIAVHPHQRVHVHGVLGWQ